MADKNDEKIDPTTDADVDMARIREMMGPLPFETDEPPKKLSKKDSKNKSKTKAITVADAAEEANASLKAMSAGMGQASITKIEDVPENEPIDEPNGDNPMSEALLNDLAKKDEPEDEHEDEPVEESKIIADDEVTVSAVDDIVSHEGDTVLKVEDDRLINAATNKKLPKTSIGDRLKDLWAKPYVKWLTFGWIFAALLTAGLVPTSRYFILNTAGVRSAMSLTVIDSSTLQPLKNVSVSAAGVNAVTDSSGVVKLDHLKLGPADITISKRAFTTINQHFTVGWGSNPQGQFRLVASGVKYTFIVTDFLSGKPVEKAEASSGDGNAISDKTGRLVLALDTSGKIDSDQIDIKITTSNYRDETVKISANNKETNSIKLVPSRKDIFASKRSGKYDIYSIDIDGKNEQKIVSGTGLEREDLTIAVQQNGDIAAYVATRENVRNSDGYLLSTLYLLDTKSGNLTKVDQSEQIQLIGWSSDQHLVYIKIVAGASGANPKRQRLMSVSAKDSTDNKELASANSFNDTLMAGDKVLYAPSNAFKDNPKPGLFMVGADNSTPVTIVNKEVFNIFRTDYETVTFDAGGTYFSYKIGAAPSSVASSTSPAGLNRLYVDNVASGRSLWLDNRDGKGVVLSYDKIAKKDTIIVSQSGLKLPMYWLNDSVIVYRVNDGRETADYAINVNGGTAKKIQDVTDTSGIGRWFYY